MGDYHTNFDNLDKEFDVKYSVEAEVIQDIDAKIEERNAEI